MREAVKEAWIAALEGGEYQQGHSYLKTEDGKNCCLGVLCELAVKAGVIPEAALVYDSWEYDGADLTLPDSVAAWAGFRVESDEWGMSDHGNPKVPNPDYDSEDDNALLPDVPRVSLAELNDADNYDDGHDPEHFNHRYDFHAIANLIREHL